MNHPKNQHWVPKFYLRQFATPETKEKKESQVWVFLHNKEDGDERLVNISKVCCLRYLYSYLDEHGERTWHLENKLAELESTLSAIWSQLANGTVDLSAPSIRKGLSLFVAIMHLRNPEVRSANETLHLKMVDFYKNIPLRPDGCPNIKSLEMNGTTYSFDPSDWLAYKSWGKNEHDRFFADMIETQATKIAEMLMHKRWSVISSNDDAFITSDRPVALQHPSRSKFGFGTRDLFITFPLSPKRMLVMDDLHKEPANQYYQLKVDTLGALNHNIWSNGSLFMITGRPVPDVLSEILTCVDSNEH